MRYRNSDCGTAGSKYTATAHEFIKLQASFIAHPLNLNCRFWSPETYVAMHAVPDSPRSRVRVNCKSVIFQFASSSMRGFFSVICSQSPNKQVRDRSQPTLMMNLPLSESAGSSSVHCLVGHW